MQEFLWSSILAGKHPQERDFSHPQSWKLGPSTRPNSRALWWAVPMYPAPNPVKAGGPPSSDEAGALVGRLQSVRGAGRKE